MGHGVEQGRGRRAVQRGVGAQHHGQERGQVGVVLRLRDGPALVGVAQPLAVQVLPAGRIPPGPDLVPHDGDQLDGAPLTAGHAEQLPGEPLALPVRGRTSQDDEEVEVAVRAQSAEGGRAVRVDAEHVAVLVEVPPDEGDEVIGAVPVPVWHMRVLPCPDRRAYRCTARLYSSLGQPGRSATMTVLDDRIAMAESDNTRRLDKMFERLERMPVPEGYKVEIVGGLSTWHHSGTSTGRPSSRSSGLWKITSDGGRRESSRTSASTSPATRTDSVQTSPRSKVGRRRTTTASGVTRMSSSSPKSFPEARRGTTTKPRRPPMPSRRYRSISSLTPTHAGAACSPGPRTAST